MDHYVYEDINCIGADDVLRGIFDELESIPDGIYILDVTYSHDRDGYVDDWEYWIAPYVDEESS